LAGESATDDIYGFDGVPVDGGDIAEVWYTGKSCFKDFGWGFVEFAMPDNFSTDSVDDANF
jgi:hypothetical protein